jgi:hypothetical protein
MAEGLLGEERWQNLKNWGYQHSPQIEAVGNLATLGRGGGGRAAASQAARRTAGTGTKLGKVMAEAARTAAWPRAEAMIADAVVAAA